jgi:hypothetical protein
LISMAVGYWVLTLAAKEKSLNQKVGKVVGWVIIAVSLLGPLCVAGAAICCHRNMGACTYMSCPMDGHGMMGGMEKDKDTQTK